MSVFYSLWLPFPALHPTSGRPKSPSPLFFFFLNSSQCLWIKSTLNMSHSTWYLSLWWQDFLTKLKPYFSLNESTPLLFKLSIQTLATSPNRYAAGIPGSTANSSYLVKGIRVALSFSQECGMAELLTKSDRLDIQSLCSRVMLPNLCCPSIILNFHQDSLI